MFYIWQNNGACNYDVPTGALVSLAVCVCPSGYEGSQCELDLDGCADNPCYSEVICTDVPANEIGQYPAGFQCDPCPFGLVGDGTSCVGMCFITTISFCCLERNTIVFIIIYNFIFSLVIAR